VVLDRHDEVHDLQRVESQFTGQSGLFVDHRNAVPGDRREQLDDVATTS